MKQCKNMMLILYEEPNKELIEALRPIKWAYVLHNKDLLDDGTLKKEHYHLLLSFETKKSLSLVAKMLNVQENLIECVNNYKSLERYLIHLDNPDKAQYSVDSVVSNYDYAVQVYSTTESIIKFLIEECENYDNIRDFNLMVMALGVDYMKVYKQYYSMIKDVIYFRQKKDNIRAQNCIDKESIHNLSDFDLMQLYEAIIGKDNETPYDMKVIRELKERGLILCKGLRKETN